MKRKLVCVGGFVLTFLIVGIASAEPCARGVCLTNNATVVTTPVVTGAIALPIYGAAYQTGAGDDETKALLRLLLEEMKAMRADMRGAPGVNAAGGPDASAVLKESCASCHTGEKAKGGFLLYTDADEQVKLSPADRREVAKRVASGNMPPPPKRLGAEQKDAIAKAMK